MKRNAYRSWFHQRFLVGSAFMLFLLPSMCAWAASSPVPTGEIKLAMATLGNETMDPVISNNDAKPMVTPFYDFLFGVSPDGKLSKDTGVAREWKLSPDSMSLTINVRPGIKFHNGDDLTAADVQFSLEQFTGERCISSEVGALRKIIKEVKTPDPMTVVINFKAPSAALPTLLSRQMGIEGCVLPKKYFEAHGAQYFNTHPVGSGPYKFVEHKSGNLIRYEAVHYPHWRVGVPKIKSIIYYIVREENARIAMLKTGEVDIAEVSRDRLKEVSELTPYEKKGFSVIGMYLNNTWDATTYLANPKFREALSLAINREEIKNFIFGGRAVITGSGMVYGSYALGYKPLPLPIYDPERAKRLVREAFPEKTIQLTMYLFTLTGAPEMPRLGEAVAGYWEKIGVKTKIVPTEYPTYRKLLAKENSPDLKNCVAIMRFGNRVLWEAAFEIAYSSKGMLTQVHDATVDKMINGLLSEIDPNKIGPDSYNLAVYLNKHFWQIPLGECGAIYMANPKKVPAWPNLSAPLAFDLYLEDLYARE